MGGLFPQNWLVRGHRLQLSPAPAVALASARASWVSSALVAGSVAAVSDGAVEVGDEVFAPSSTVESGGLVDSVVMALLSRGPHPMADRMIVRKIAIRLMTQTMHAGQEESATRK